jgi:hypothetical protein
MQYHIRSFRKGWSRIAAPAFVFLGLYANAGAARPFSDALFEKLDATALETEARALSAKTDDAAKAEVLQVNLFRADLARYEHRLHAANDLLEDLCDRCRNSDIKDPKARTLSAAVCALAEAERLRQGAGAIAAWRLASDLSVHVAQVSALDQSDRLYFDGRLYGTLPPVYGQNFGKSLLAWMMLSRLEPDRAAVDFWLGRTYQMQGNHSKAVESYARAESRGNTTTRYFFQDGRMKDEPEWNDGLSAGWHPGLFYNPARGFGALVQWHDDRLGDEPRSARAAVSASTRGSYGLDAGITDTLLLPGNTLRLEGMAFYGYQDFYGLGARTLSSSRVGLLTQRERVEIAARRDFLDSFFFELGWRIANFSIADSAGSVIPARGNAFLSGPIAQLGYDTRDSRVYAHRGSLVFIQGFYPQDGLGSDSNFERWTFHAEHHLPIGFSDAVHLKGHFEFTHGTETTFGEIPRLADDFMLPGVRPGRFQDRALVAFTAESNLKIWGPLSLVVFGNVASVAPTGRDIPTSIYHWGGGGGVLWQSGALRSQFVRLDAGRFGDETVFNFSGGQDL